MKISDTPTHFWNSRLFQAGLIAVFIALLIAGVISGELRLIRIESSTL